MSSQSVSVRNVEPVRAWPTLLFLVLGAGLRWLAFSAARKRERAKVFRAVLGGYLGAIVGK